MGRFRNILTRPVTVLFVALSLLCVSCGKDDTSTIPILSFKTNPVPKEAGSQHLSVTATADWSVSVSYTGSQSDWLSTNRTSGDKDNGDLVLRYTENLEEEDRLATIRVQSGSKSSEYTFTQKGHKVEVPAGTARVWMELPEIDPHNSGCAFFTHTMTVGSVSTRNYSYYWDYADRVSLWVAYPLNSWNIGSYYGRSDAWAFDPLLPASLQSDVSSGYGRGNDGDRYDRGHQIPSADRQGSYANNAQTFYGTNMTPQNNGFNSGLWAHLEGSVRKWADKSDTLYVLTGCVVEPGLRKYVTDASSNKVAIPVAYYKALLRYQRSSTVGVSGSDFMGCAFYFDHVEYSAAGKKDLPVSSGLSISIAELEKKLGYRLFANLDAKVGEETAAKIKNQNPSQVSWWWNNK